MYLRIDWRTQLTEYGRPRVEASARFWSRIEFPLECDAERLVALGKFVAVDSSELVLEGGGGSHPASVSGSMSTGSTNVTRMWPAPGM